MQHRSLQPYRWKNVALPRRSRIHVRPKKLARFARACARAPLRVLAHISAYDARTGLALFCWKPELRAQSAAGVPHPQRATVSRVHARLSCVTSARGHQLRRGMQEKAPFPTSDNRRPSRARGRHFNLSSLAQKRLPPRLVSRAASREGKLCLVGDCLSWQGSKSYVLPHLIAQSIQYTAIH